MPRPRSCPSCSARLPRDALYCQSCGRSIGFDLDVATVDEDEGDDQLPIGPEPSHRVRNVLIGVAVLAALAVGAVVVSRNDEPATTAATTTTAAPTSSGESTTTTTQPPYVERGGRPVLAVANGTVVYGLSREDQLVRLELETGRTSFRTLDLNGEPEGWRLIPRTGGVLVVSYNESPLWVADGPEGVGVDLNLPVQGEVMPGPKPDEFLVLDSNSYRSEQRLGIYRTDGTEVHPPVLLPAMSYYISDGAGGLLGFGGGHTYAIDLATGQPTLVAQQIVSGTSPAVLVEVACSVDYRCTWRVTDRATGAVRNSPTRPTRASSTSSCSRAPCHPTAATSPW